MFAKTEGRGDVTVNDYRRDQRNCRVAVAPIGASARSSPASSASLLIRARVFLPSRFRLRATRWRPIQLPPKPPACPRRGRKCIYICSSRPHSGAQWSSPHERIKLPSGRRPTRTSRVCYRLELNLSEALYVANVAENIGEPSPTRFVYASHL